MTPLPLARMLVAAVRPSGVILEPCAGTGNFVRALRPYGTVVTCEIDHGKDFLHWTRRVDWVLGNPPWSRFKEFLQHAMTVADNVAFLCTLNHLWTRRRVQGVRKAGFGYRQMLLVDGPAEWRPTGFQVGMVVISRGFDGPCDIQDLAATLDAP